MFSRIVLQAYDPVARVAPDPQRLAVHERAETAERIRPIGAQDRRPSPLPNLRPVDASEEFRVKMEAVYEHRQSFPPEERGDGCQKPPKGENQGPAGTDLSLLCDRLFVSGLSSSRITANRKKDDQDDG